MERLNASDLEERIAFAKKACEFFNREGNEKMTSWEDEDGAQWPYNWIAVKSSAPEGKCTHVMVIEPAREPAIFYEVCK